MRVVNITLVLAAAIFAAYSFVKFGAAGLPYQDATSDQLATQQNELRIWGACIFLSIIVFVVGIFGIRKSSRTRERQTDAST